MIHLSTEQLLAGLDAMQFVNSEKGRELNLRGFNARLVEPGTIRIGDVAERVA